MPLHIAQICHINVTEYPVDFYIMSIEQCLLHVEHTMVFVDF